MGVGRDWVRRLHKVQCQRVGASPWGSPHRRIITIQIIRVVLNMVVVNMVNNMVTNMVSNNNAKVISTLRNSSNPYSNNHLIEADNYQINNNKANTDSRNPLLQTTTREELNNNFTKANIINNNNIMKANTLINNKMINMRNINKKSHKFKGWLWTNCLVGTKRIPIPGSLITITTIIIIITINNNKIIIILKVVAKDSNMEATQGITLNNLC